MTEIIQSKHTSYSEYTIYSEGDTDVGKLRIKKGRPLSTMPMDAGWLSFCDVTQFCTLEMFLNA